MVECILILGYGQFLDYLSGIFRTNTSIAYANALAGAPDWVMMLEVLPFWMGSSYALPNSSSSSSDQSDFSQQREFFQDHVFTPMWFHHTPQRYF